MYLSTTFSFQIRLYVHSRLSSPIDPSRDLHACVHGPHWYLKISPMESTMSLIVPLSLFFRPADEEDSEEDADDVDADDPLRIEGDGEEEDRPTFISSGVYGCEPVRVWCLPCVLDREWEGGGAEEEEDEEMTSPSLLVISLVEKKLAREGEGRFCEGGGNPFKRAVSCEMSSKHASHDWRS